MQAENGRQASSGTLSQPVAPPPAARPFVKGGKAMRCPDCGAANPTAAKFCGDCGHRVGADDPPAQPVTQPSFAAGGTAWDGVFKWIGIGVVGLFVLGLLAGM
jgi:hypothetical protein